MPTEEGEEDTFSRSYVEDLRSESAQHRIALKPFKEAFDGMDEKEVTYLLGIMRGLTTDQAGTALELRDLSYQLAGEEAFLEGVPWEVNQDPGGEMPEPEVVDEAPPQGVTLEQITEMLDARDAAKAEADMATAKTAADEAVVDSIVAEARELGFEVGTPEFQALIYHTERDENQDLQKAALEARKAYPAVSEGDEPAPEPAAEFPKGADAGGAGSQPAPPVEAPKTQAEAREAMMARLDRQD